MINQEKEIDEWEYFEETMPSNDLMIVFHTVRKKGGVSPADNIVRCHSESVARLIAQAPTLRAEVARVRESRLRIIDEREQALKEVARLTAALEEATRWPTVAVSDADKIARLTAERDEARKPGGGTLGISAFDQGVKFAADQYETQLAELRKDGERLDWLASCSYIKIDVDRYGNGLRIGIDRDDGIRAALDAARKEHA